MSAELIGGVIFLLVVVGGVLGLWKGREQFGAEREKRKQAEEEATHADARADSALAPPASRSEARAILRDRLARASRRLRARKGDRPE